FLPPPRTTPWRARQRSGPEDPIRGLPFPFARSRLRSLRGGASPRPGSDRAARRPSKWHRFCLHLGRDGPVNSTFVDDIHGAANDLLDSQAKAGPVQKRMGPIPRHEKIDVALLGRLPSTDRAEHANLSDPVTPCDTKDLLPMGKQNAVDSKSLAEFHRPYFRDVP